jgi:hypothetical protein
MDTKLTLSINEAVIKKAKAFASKNHTSLSQVVENYLAEITRKETGTQKDDISPLVKSLSGVLQLPDNFDHKKEREQYLSAKYK